MSCHFLLLDVTSAGAKGHFYQASVDIIQALLENQNSVTFIADYHVDIDSRIAAGSLSLLREQIGCRNLLLHVKSEFEKDDARKVHVLIMWSGDLLECNFSELDEFLLEHSSDLSIITNGSRLLRNWPDFKQELDFIRKFGDLKSSRDIWIWDPAASKQIISPKLRWLPEFHAKVYDEEFQFPRQNSIGFFGALTVGRGLGDTLMLAALNPSVKFFIRGYGSLSLKSWRPKNYRGRFRNPFKFLCGILVSAFFISLMKLPNVNYQEVYFEDEKSLVKEMRKNQAIFYSADRHPYSSGIALLAVANLVPVIWIPGNSAANDNLETRYHAGRISRKDLFKPFKVNKLLNSLPEVKENSKLHWENLKHELAKNHGQCVISPNN